MKILDVITRAAPRCSDGSLAHWSGSQWQCEDTATGATHTSPAPACPPGFGFDTALNRCVKTPTKPVEPSYHERFVNGYAQMVREGLAGPGDLGTLSGDTMTPYTVRPNDTPARIAQFWTGNPAREGELIRVNPQKRLQRQGSYVTFATLKVGEKLNIPKTWTHATGFGMFAGDPGVCADGTPTDDTDNCPENQGAPGTTTTVPDSSQGSATGAQIWNGTNYQPAGAPFTPVPAPPGGTPTVYVPSPAPVPAPAPTTKSSNGLLVGVIAVAAIGGVTLAYMASNKSKTITRHIKPKAHHAHR